MDSAVEKNKVNKRMISIFNFVAHWLWSEKRTTTGTMSRATASSVTMSRTNVSIRFLEYLHSIIKHVLLAPIWLQGPRTSGHDRQMCYLAVLVSKT
jgi:hypothetical protein